MRQPWLCTCHKCRTGCHCSACCLGPKSTEVCTLGRRKWLDQDLHFACKLLPRAAVASSVAGPASGSHSQVVVAASFAAEDSQVAASFAAEDSQAVASSAAEGSQAASFAIASLAAASLAAASLAAASSAEGASSAAVGAAPTVGVAVVTEQLAHLQQAPTCNSSESCPCSRPCG